jgi:hypothetical protein
MQGNGMICRQQLEQKLQINLGFPENIGLSGPVSGAVDQQRTVGKGEVESSNLSGSTRKPKKINHIRDQPGSGVCRSMQGNGIIPAFSLHGQVHLSGV